MNRRHRSWVGPFRLLMLLSLCDATHAADEERGRALYHEHGCYSCHGHQGKGTFAVAQTNLLPKPPPLVVGVAPFLMSEDVFRVYLRLRGGEQPAEPVVRMPHYPESALGDEAVADLYAHIGTFKEESPPLDAIPVMRAILESAAGD